MRVLLYDEGEDQETQDCVDGYFTDARMIEAP